MNPMLSASADLSADAAALMQDILDIKPSLPLNMGNDGNLQLLKLLTGLFLLALFLLWRVLRRRKKLAFQTPRTPEEIALAALARAEGLLDDHRAFAFTLSDAVRTFLEARTNVQALEMPVEELLPRLDDMLPDVDVCRRTKNLLRRADQVKFAKYETTRSSREDDLATLRLLIAALEPRREEGA